MKTVLDKFTIIGNKILKCDYYNEAIYAIYNYFDGELTGFSFHASKVVLINDTEAIEIIAEDLYT